MPSRRTASSERGLSPRACRIVGATCRSDTEQPSVSPPWRRGSTTTSGTWVSSALPLPWSTNLAFGAAYTMPEVGCTTMSGIRDGFPASCPPKSVATAAPPVMVPAPIADAFDCSTAAASAARLRSFSQTSAMVSAVTWAVRPGCTLSMKEVNCAGSTHLSVARLTGLLASFRLSEAIRFMRAMVSLPGASPVLIAQALEPAVSPRLRGLLRRIIGRPTLPPWIDARWFADRMALTTVRSLAGSKQFFHDALAQGLTETVLPALLRYGDRNSMAFSIESRVPFLTAALADLAYSLPAAQLIDGRANSKAVLRMAMRGVVPDQILDRRDKVAFSTPDRMWARSLQPWFVRTFTSEAARSLPWLKADVALQTLEQRTARSAPFGFDLWRTISVIRWIERFNVAIA